MSAHLYRETLPDRDLAPFIESLWLFRPGTLTGNAPPHVIVPDGAASISLVFPPGGAPLAGLVGPAVRAHQVPLLSGALYCGIRLRPGRAKSVLKCDMQNFCDTIGAHTEPLPPAAGQVRAVLDGLSPVQRASDSAIDAAIARAARTIVCSADPLDGPVCALADAIMEAGGDVRLSALAEQSGLGPRQLRRRFLVQCGLSPKAFARLRRLRQSCIALVRSGDECMAETALASGFSDQAHMAREFREIFGSSAALVRAYLRQIRHEGAAAHPEP